MSNLHYTDLLNPIKLVNHLWLKVLNSYFSCWTQGDYLQAVEFINRIPSLLNPVGSPTPFEWPDSDEIQAIMAIWSVWIALFIIQYIRISRKGDQGSEAW